MLGGNASPTDYWHDPLTYLEFGVGASGVIKIGGTLKAAIGVTAATGAASTTTSTTWPGPWEGRQVFNGINYSYHALLRMMPKIGYGGRGIPPSVVENALNHGEVLPGNTPDTIVMIYENVLVVWNFVEKIVVTVRKR